MSEVKDPAIKLFGRTISLPHIIDSSSASAPKPTPSSSSSPREVTSATQQHEPEESSRKELTSSQDDDASHQIREDVKSPTTSSSILENPKTPSAETDTSTIPKSPTNGEESETSDSEEKAPKKPDKIIPCPRCNSMDTKFCYYNNYNVNQPRHFCKNCQRYWTAGGTMRNVPVGAGRRKNKSSSAAASYYQHIMLPNGLHNAVLGNGSSVLTFGPDSPLTDTMASRLNIAERAKSCVPNGFHATEPNSFVSYRKEDDGTSGVSVGTTSSSSHSGSQSHESVDKRFEGFTPQLPYFPSAPWSYPMPPPTYPLSFYPTQAYWGCMPMPPSWNNNSVSAPTLGKHPRDENIIAPSNPQREMHDVEHNSSEHSVLIPKALRIEDHSEAAKSSMWSKLGIKNDKSSSGGLFNAFPSKGNHIAEEASSVLQVNPAALSRSLAFHEQT